MSLYVSKRTQEQARLVGVEGRRMLMESVTTGKTKEICRSTFLKCWKRIPQGLPVEYKTIPLEIAEAIKKLEDLFDLLNGLYFNNELERPVITVKTSQTHFKRCSTKKDEISIGADFLNRLSENTAAAMCHEMIHLFCQTHGINETSQNGRYHNKIFKAQALACDLTVGYDSVVGSAMTSPAKAFTQKLTDAGFATGVPFARFSVLAKQSAKKTREYMCPCGQAVRSMRELNLICGICGGALEMVN